VIWVPSKDSEAPGAARFTDVTPPMSAAALPGAGLMLTRALAGSAGAAYQVAGCPFSPGAALLIRTVTRVPELAAAVLTQLARVPGVSAAAGWRGWWRGARRRLGAGRGGGLLTLALDPHS
jgi:hypothetical protein